MSFFMSILKKFTNKIKKPIELTKSKKKNIMKLYFVKDN